ncbi:MAG TPA: AsmA family protein [Terriglobia bacterium]|nr:AsmA family protein [Terriglobia bacterium]
MSPRKRRYLRNITTALILVLISAWVVPSFFNADRYRPLLTTALEKALHRRITFGHIALHLFPQPGFTIDSVIVGEAPPFGLEPFARVESIDCELLWRSVWQSGLKFGTLELYHPSINLVRNAAGEWNIENLLLNSGIARASGARGSRAAPPPPLRIEAEDARFNFKLRQDKKPFAIVDATADMHLDFASRSIRFKLTGDPVRTDLELPTPGMVVLAGTWRPAQAAGNTLNATLQTQGALLYDWIPLLTGYNPGVYGVMGSSIHLTGTLRRIAFDGNAQLSQLHRWEQLPLSNDLPCRLHFQGLFDRDQRKLALKTFHLAFASSEASVNGSIDKLTSIPDFDLVVAFKKSRVADLLRLGRRVLGRRFGWDVTGSVDGKVGIQGAWAKRRYQGALEVRDLRLHTTSGVFPVSRVAVQIGGGRVRLSPVKVRLAPDVEVVAEGTLRDISPAGGRRRLAVKPHYDFTVYSHTIGLADLLKLGRAFGLSEASNFTADGAGTFTLHATGWAWPLSKPNITARATIRSARLMIPGLTEPLNIPRARIQIYGKQIIVNPVVAVMGTSVFSGWLMHGGPSREPWNFRLSADKLSIDQGAQWFAATQSSGADSFFERLSGISGLLGSSRPAYSVFSRLSAQGHFASSVVNYRLLRIRNFQADIQILHRSIRVSDATFEAGAGRGKGKMLVDLGQSPARISAEASTDGTRLQTLTPYLPATLAKLRGFYSASGHFTARGITHAAIMRSLQGEARIKFQDVDLGNFDPVRLIARHSGMDVFEADPLPALIPSALAQLQVQNRQVTLSGLPLNVSGASLKVSGSYEFDGSATLRVHADLSGLPSRWLQTQPVKGRLPRLAEVRLGGTLRHLRVVPSMRLSQKQP